MSNGRTLQHRMRNGCRGVGLLALALTALLRVDSSHWMAWPGPAWTRYATPVGSINRVILQDGSRVDLNTDSEIEARFTGLRREVVLVQGEALFNVVPHEDWLFLIRAGGVTVRATGTRFSIRLREDKQTEVLVAEGGLGIDAGGAAPAARLAQRGSSGRAGSIAYTRRDARFSLTANAPELISLNSTTVLSVTELTSAALKRRTAWTEGWLWFAQEPLPEALAQFNRYHPQRLVLVDPALAGFQIGGRFRSTDLESFIATLEHSFNVRRIPAAVHRTDTQTIYLARGCTRAQQQCNWSLVQ